MVEQAIMKWRQLVQHAQMVLPLSVAQGHDNPGVVALCTILLGQEGVPATIRDLGRPMPGMFVSGQNMLNDEQARQLLPISPPVYNADTLTNCLERFFASEMIRAAIFQTLKKEVLYCCEVRVTQFKEPFPNKKKQVIQMATSVLVERESQKAIVVGKGGLVIKQVGMEV